MTFGELFYRLQDRIEECRSFERTQFQNLVEARRAEHLACRVVGLGDAVGVKDDLVAGLQLLYAFRILLLVDDAPWSRLAAAAS
jgi:hypothetical protein